MQIADSNLFIHRSLYFLFLVEVTGIEPVSVNANSKTTTSVVSVKVSPMPCAETHGQRLVPQVKFRNWYL